VGCSQFTADKPARENASTKGLETLSERNKFTLKSPHTIICATFVSNDSRAVKKISKL